MFLVEERRFSAASKAKTNGALSPRSEPPHNPGRSAVIVLISAGIMRVHVVALKTPREVLEPELVVDASPDVNQQRPVSKPARTQSPDAGHRMYERPPLSHVGRKAWAAGDVVFGFAAPVKAAPVSDQAEVRKTDEWKRLK